MPLDIRSLFSDALPPINLLDAGAMAVNDKKPNYASLLPWRNVTVSGFEPEAAACENLNASAAPNCRFWPMALGDGEAHKFRHCAHPMTSSLYPPNFALTDEYQSLSEWMQVLSMETIQTVRMDDIPDLPPSHYQKLDVQGAELDILRHGLRHLETTVCLHVEVSFVPIYKNQPLFADIDQFLRGQGFQFHRLHTYSSRAVKPFIADNNPSAPMSQWLWGDAVYCSNLTQLDELDTDSLLRLAILLHEIYGSYDVADLVLRHIDRRNNSNLTESYRAALMKQERMAS